MSKEIVVISQEEMESLQDTAKESGFGALVTPTGALPLVALAVHARLEGLLADVVVTQTFTNSHREPLEATYIFPLPDRSAVTGFHMTVGGRLVDGVLKERAEARREYDEALKSGHRAAVAEEERPGLFTLRVGNIMPSETAEIRLTMVGPVAFDGSEVTWQFPLVVAPRYIPGVPLSGASVGAGTAVDTDAVPDASRISPPVLLPGFPNPVQFSLTADVGAGRVAISELRSSLHAVITESAGDDSYRIRAQPGERLNRDFILRYRLGEQAVETSLTVVPDSGGITGASEDGGTFVLTVYPPADDRSAKARARDVVFVLDRSGSMAGWKMVAARRALGRMIDSLTTNDRFAVLAFDDQTEWPQQCAEGLIVASDRSRYRALEWLAGVDARGGTEMAQPLVLAVEMLKPGRERVLVLVTDGQVGNEDQILHALAQRLQGIRIFTLGIDRAVNEAFLRRLAALGGGSSDLVESEDRLDEVMAKVQRRIGSPRLSALQLTPQGMKIDWQSLVPARLPDLFPGVPVTIMGRYIEKATGGLKVTAVDDAGLPWVQEVEGRLASQLAASAVWARGRLRDLEDQWVGGTVTVPAEFEKRMVELSLQYGVLCRFTAFVAVDRSAIVNEGGKANSIVQPVELPEGWELPGQAGIFQTAPILCLSQSASKGQRPILCADADGDDSDLESPMEGEEVAMATWYDADESDVAEAEAAADMTAYRQRAVELAEQVLAEPDHVRRLGIMRLQLQALVEDLQSVAADAGLVQPLADALAKLVACMAERPLQLGDSGERVVGEAIAALRAFANASAD
jgi:Ca-activated chloride channel homolog